MVKPKRKTIRGEIVLRVQPRCNLRGADSRALTAMAA